MRSSERVCCVKTVWVCVFCLHSFFPYQICFLLLLVDFSQLFFFNFFSSIGPGVASFSVERRWRREEENSNTQIRCEREENAKKGELDQRIRALRDLYEEMWCQLLLELYSSVFFSYFYWNNSYIFTTFSCVWVIRALSCLSFSTKRASIWNLNRFIWGLVLLLHESLSLFAVHAKNCIYALIALWTWGLKKHSQRRRLAEMRQ